MGAQGTPGRRAGRGRLTSVDKLGTYFPHELERVIEELARRDADQSDILRRLNGRLAAQDGPKISKGAFSRFSIRLSSAWIGRGVPFLGEAGFAARPASAIPAIGKPRLVPRDDFAFVDSKAAGAAIRENIRLREEQSFSRSRASIAAVLQFIDQRVQTGRNVGPVVNEITDDLAGYRKGMIAKRAIESIGCYEMGEDELLESVDAILQFLKLVLINCGHGGESPDVAEPDPFTPTPNAPHCLSENAE